MVLSTVQSDTPDEPASESQSLGYDFALLGLGAREARVEVIRQAAGETAAQIQQTFVSRPCEVSTMLAELATSTYRLLDPRRRKRRFERIQLSVYSEGDLELQKKSLVPIISPEPLIAAEVVVEQHE